MNRLMLSRATLVLVFALSASSAIPTTSFAAKKSAAEHELVVPQVTYHTVEIDGTKVFYR